ncbi:MAG TPA: hypothetical protein VEZ15_06500, partial [Acidimicrobiia bacterium]|nr:hypothetical protein [Acidimicrobiia bacterium]
VPSGRIPEPPAHTPAASVANVTLALALAPANTRQSTHCEALLRPVLRTLDKGERLTLRGSNATVVYLPDRYPASAPKRIAPATFVALAGPLRLRIAPARSSANPGTTHCR